MRMNAQVGTVWYQRCGASLVLWSTNVKQAEDGDDQSKTLAWERRGSGEEVEARGRILDAAFADAAALYLQALSVQPEFYPAYTRACHSAVGARPPGRGDPVCREVTFLTR